jgi:glycosyltransferase involved in cell wall biosynthesis
LGIGTSTRFFPLVPHEEVPALLRCFDVLVLPSRTTAKLKEQFGRILVEGMAAGCAVIGSSSGEIPAVLEDAGLVFSEGDVAGLAEAIGRVIAQPDLRAALRTRGRCRVREHFTWEVVAERLVEFYRRIHAGG